MAEDVADGVRGRRVCATRHQQGTAPVAPASRVAGREGRAGAVLPRRPISLNDSTAGYATKLHTCDRKKAGVSHKRKYHETAPREKQEHEGGTETKRPSPCCLPFYWRRRSCHVLCVTPGMRLRLPTVTPPSVPKLGAANAGHAGRDRPKERVSLTGMFSARTPINLWPPVVSPHSVPPKAASAWLRIFLSPHQWCTLPQKRTTCLSGRNVPISSSPHTGFSKEGTTTKYSFFKQPRPHTLRAPTPRGMRRRRALQERGCLQGHRPINQSTRNLLRKEPRFSLQRRQSKRNNGNSSRSLEARPDAPCLVLARPL